LAKKYSIDKYPFLVALIGDEEQVEKYTGKSFDSESISNWLNRMSKRYFQADSKSKSRKKSK
jgi:hypothetical protein